MFICQRCNKEYKSEVWYLRHLDKEHSEDSVVEDALIEDDEVEFEIYYIEPYIISKIPHISTKSRLATSLLRPNRK